MEIGDIYAKYQRFLEKHAKELREIFSDMDENEFLENSSDIFDFFYECLYTWGKVDWW